MISNNTTEIRELRISDLARGGAGVAREESGRIVFVPYTLPGDVVRAEITETHKNYADARLLEILTPSENRVTAKCPVFTRCGGCEWQHIPYELQWKTKLSGLQHALKRVQISWNGAWDELPAQKIFHYRNRIQLRGFREEIGFFGRGSKDLVPITNCPIAREELNEKIPALLEEGKQRSRPYKVEVEVLENGEVRTSWNSGHAALGFRQVHDEQNAAMKLWVKTQALEAGGDELWDLYGGFGNLSLGLAKNFSTIHCVDVSSPENNPPAGTPENFHYHRSPVHLWLKSGASGKVKRTVILDPPREGLAEYGSEIIMSLEKLGATHAIAVGCDADSWARDLSRFARRGWKVKKFGAVDLFPQTHHVEALAFLVREE